MVRRAPGARQGTLTGGHRLGLRICVLASGSRGNCTWIATERTRLLIDAGLSKRETYVRLRAVGERPETCDGVIISHEHADHVSGLRKLALDLRRPVYINAATRRSLEWDPGITAFETFVAGERFVLGDIEVTPFSIPHDAA